MAKIAKVICGYYPVKYTAGFLHHTYSLMTFNGKRYDFCCYGGSDDANKVLPAEMRPANSKPGDFVKEAECKF